MRVSDKALVGLTFVASASPQGVPGNADSFDPSWSLRTSQVLSFTSRATNLDHDRDRTRSADVYVSAQIREVRFFGVREVNRAKYATLLPHIRVVSVNAAARAGNGPSEQSNASDQGCFVTFVTRSTDIIGGDNGPQADIVRADIRGFLISHKVLDTGDPKGCRDIEGAAAPGGDRIKITAVARGNGPSTDPETAGGGEYTAFESSADRFSGTRDDWFGVASGDADLNARPDTFLYTGVRNLIRVFSAAPKKRQLAYPSTNPFPSQRVNYLLFETTDPTATREVAGYDDAGTGQGGAFRAPPIVEAPITNQIYLRYLGPRNP